MRVWVVLLAFVIIGFFCGIALAQDSSKPSSPVERVDLPVEKPIKPDNDKGSGDDDKGGSGDDDDADDNEEPPVEFFDNEIKANKFVYVMDKTGSMSGRVGHPITDEKGNVISNPTKWQQIKAEFKKSVLGLGENAKFTALVYSGYATSPGDIVVWRTTLQKATPENKASAMAWIEGFSPYSVTPIWDATKRALDIPEVETILLHTDGVANVYDGSYHGESYSAVVNNCDVTKSRIIPAAKAKGVKIHTFAHALSSFYSPDVAAVGEQMLKDIAAGTGGTFTKVN